MRISNFKLLQRPGALALLLASLWPAMAVAGDDPNAPMGTNLNAVTDFSDEFPFVNLMKSARDWIPGNVAGCFDCRDGGANPACNAPNSCPVTINRDADGYVSSLAPQQVVRTLLHAGGTPGRLAPGQYTVRFDGVGTLQFFGANVVSSSPGEIVIQIADSTGNNIGFNLTATTPGNHLRNLRILPPGGVCSNDARRSCDASTPCAAGGSCQLYTTPGVAEAQIFQPRFLANLAPYRLIRFMDWMETNSSPVQSVADYPGLSSAFWHRVPPEILAALGNRTGSDIWINIPHRANDGFVDAFATVLRDTFRSDRKIYIEYSNENWNGIFSQGREIAQQFCGNYADLAANCLLDGAPANSTRCELDPNTFSIPEPAGSACFQALVRAWGDRSTAIFDRFDAVFGANARARLVRVIAAQAANADLGRQILARTVTGQGFSVASRTDAYASAPYFGTEYCQPFEGINPDTHPAVFATSTSFLDHLESAGLARARGFMSSSRAMLANHFASLGIRHIAYEGGQHLVGVGSFTFDPVCNARFDEANRSPRMQTIYRSYFDDWRANGDEFTHFVNVGRWSVFGRWAMLEFQDQDPLSSPKFQALLGHSAAHPCHWPLCSQTGASAVNPTLGYTPAAGSLAAPAAGPSFPPGPAGTASTSIAIQATGAVGSGASSLSGCVIEGGGAASFAAPIVLPAGGLFNASVSSGSIGLSCTRGASAATAQLRCLETPAGGTGQERVWALSCPAAQVSDPIHANGFESAPVSCTPAQLLADPSLEATSSNGQSNPFWASTSTEFGTVYCSAALCPNDGSNPAPRTGSFYAWFGGTTGVETSTLTQSVQIPAGAPRFLNLFLRQARSTAPFDAQLQLRIDGQLLRSFTESASTDPAYVVRSVDVTAFANGQTHVLALEYSNPGGSGVSNFFVDDLELGCSAAAR